MGGELLLGARSVAKDPYNQLHAELAPGPFASLPGLRVDQHESYPDDIDRAVSMSVSVGDEGETNSKRRSWHVWGEWLILGDAVALATHADDLAAGKPAVARNDVGDGTVVYCGVWPGADLAADLVERVPTRAGVSMLRRLPRAGRRGRARRVLKPIPGLVEV